MSDHASHSHESKSHDESRSVSGESQDGDKSYWGQHPPVCSTAQPIGYNACNNGQYIPSNSGYGCVPTPCVPNPCYPYNAYGCCPCPAVVCTPCVATSLPSRSVLSANQFDSQQALAVALDVAATQSGIATNVAVNRANFNLLIAGLACGYIEDLGDSYMDALRSQVINESDVVPAVFTAEVAIVNAFALHAEGRAASESILATMSAQFFAAIGQLLTASFAADLLTLRTTYYTLMATIAGWPASINTQLLAAGLVMATYDFTPVTACAGVCTCSCIFCSANPYYYTCSNTSCSCIVAST